MRALSVYMVSRDAYSSLMGLQPRIKLEAHESEVLGLEYMCARAPGVHLLASCSRDRLIHLFDVTRNYAHVQTIDEHSGAVTALKFIMVPSAADSERDSENPNARSLSPVGSDRASSNDDNDCSRSSVRGLRLVSSSTDHSLLFRSLQVSERRLLCSILY